MTSATVAPPRADEGPSLTGLPTDLLHMVLGHLTGREIMQVHATSKVLAKATGAVTFLADYFERQGAPARTLPLSGRQGLARLATDDNLRRGRYVERPICPHPGLTSRHGLFAADGSLLISAADEKEVALWDRAGTSLQMLPVPGRRINRIEASESARRLLICQADSTVLWSRKGGSWTAQQLAKRYTHGNRMGALSADGRHALVAETDASSTLWSNLDAARPSRTILDMSTPDDSDGIRATALSRDGTWAAITTASEVYAFDLRVPSQPVRTKLQETGQSRPFIRLSQDDRWLLAPHPLGLSLRDRDQDWAERIVLRHVVDVADADISRSGKWVATVDRESHVRLWDVTAPEERLTDLGAGFNDINSVRFSPEGSQLILGSYVYGRTAQSDACALRLLDFTADPLVKATNLRRARSSPRRPRAAAPGTTPRMWRSQSCGGRMDTEVPRVERNDKNDFEP